MAQPTPYTVSYDFTAFQTANPTTPLPADKHEVEYNNIATSIGEIIDNIALIQRDDGQLANESVGTDQLAPGILAILGAGSGDIATVAGIDTEITVVAGISADVTTVAGISANVTTVAGISADVSAVAAIDSDVTAVANNITNVNAVGGYIANINTVAGIEAEVVAVAGNATNVNIVAGLQVEITRLALISGAIANVDANEANITTVATNIADINTVAGNIGDVNTVAGISASVSTVAANDANITTVATDIVNVNTVAGISAAVSAVAANEANINTVATDIADVSTVATNIANVNTVAANMATITDAANNIPKANRTATTNPTVNDDSGDGYSEASVWVNTTSDEVFFCADPALGAAIWVSVTAAGTLSSLADVSFTGLANNDFIKYNGSMWINRTPANVRTDLGLVIGTNVQAYDAELAAIAGLTSAADTGFYFSGSGTAATYSLTSFGRTFGGLADASAARTNLGLVIGTNVQAYDAELAAIAGLTSAADRLPYFTGSGTAALATFTAAGRNLIDDADTTAQRSTLGLGTADSPTFTALTTTGGINCNGQFGGSSDIFAGANSIITWYGKSKMSSIVDGIILFTNDAVNSFTGFKLGGTTSAFPYIKRNGAAINIRLADDSADADITFKTQTAGDNSTKGATTAYADAAAKLPFRTTSAATTLVAADKGGVVELTGSTNRTWDATAVATLGVNWSCFVHNNSTAILTFDPNSTEQVDNLTTLLMYPGELRRVNVNAAGTAFETQVLQGFTAVFDSSTSFTVPPGYTTFGFELISGGAAGASRTTTGNAGGGGSGGVYDFFVPASKLVAAGSTETITVAAVAAGVTGNTAGTVGNNTSVTLNGSTITVNGGQGGQTAALGAAVEPAYTGAPSQTILATFIGVAAGAGRWYPFNTSGATASTLQLLASSIGGNVTAGNVPAVGGSSTLGPGGGGGCSSTAGGVRSGGTSILAGNGGAGGANTGGAGTNGTAPGGGGGGAVQGGTSGSGAPGRVTIRGII